MNPIRFQIERHSVAKRSEVSSNTSMSALLIFDRDVHIFHRSLAAGAGWGYTCWCHAPAGKTQISSWTRSAPAAHDSPAGALGPVGIAVPNMSGSSLFVPSGTAENALPRQFHGGRCVGIFDPPVEVDPDMPALLPAPSATLRSRAGGLPRCEVTDARQRPDRSHAVLHPARCRRKHGAQDHLRTALTRCTLPSPGCRCRPAGSLHHRKRR